MSAIIGSETENILRGAAWSGTAPLASYALTTFERFEPAARVRYGATSATVTATLGAAARGDILAIPVAGATGLTVTNNNGLSEVVPVPTLPSNRIPLTIMFDLTLAEPNATTRTADVWNFAFTGTSNITLGAYIGLFSPRTEFEDADFQWGLIEAVKAFGRVTENDHGVLYRQNNRTLRRRVSGTKLSLATDVAALRAWYAGSFGQYGVSLLWPDPDVNDGLIGVLPEELEIVTMAPTGDDRVYQARIDFRELVKGRPV